MRPPRQAECLVRGRDDAPWAGPAGSPSEDPDEEFASERNSILRDGKSDQ